MDLDFSSGAVVRQRVVVPSRARGPRYRREDPDNDEGAIAVKALVCVQNKCQLQLGLVLSPNFGE